MEEKKNNMIVTFIVRLNNFSSEWLENIKPFIFIILKNPVQFFFLCHIYHYLSIFSKKKHAFSLIFSVFLFYFKILFLQNPESLEQTPAIDQKKISLQRTQTCLVFFFFNAYTRGRYILLFINSRSHGIQRNFPRDLQWKKKFFFFDFEYEKKKEKIKQVHTLNGHTPKFKIQISFTPLNRRSFYYLITNYSIVYFFLQVYLSTWIKKFF